MAINIQNLLNAINTKVQALDSSSDNTEVIKLSKLAKNINATSGVLKYRSRGELPAVDSAYLGLIVYVEDKVVDQYGSFYYGLADSWQKLTLTADSDEANISFGSAYTFGGTNYGYTSGGSINPGNQNTIDTFSFTSDGNATDVGDLTLAREYCVGQSSTISGYTSGGSPDTLVIDKFPFVSGGNATTVGNLTNRMFAGSGHHTENNGYHAGGFANVSLTSSSNINEIAFASDGDATTVGNLSTARSYNTGQSSSTHGYSMTIASVIRDKFPFASGGTAVNFNSGLPGARINNGAGQSSSTDGYYTGFYPTTTYIDKYPFASDTFLADIGDMSVTRYFVPGQSSTTYGYTSGGVSPVTTPSVTNIIDKFPFASDGNATDVGDLTVNRMRSAGQQY